MCMHTTAEHDAMKTDEVWPTLEFVGHQPGDDFHGDLEMRNAACGSTLCRRCLLTETQRDVIRAATRARNEAFRQAVAAAQAAQAVHAVHA